MAFARVVGGGQLEGERVQGVSDDVERRVERSLRSGIVQAQAECGKRSLEGVKRAKRKPLDVDGARDAENSHRESEASRMVKGMLSNQIGRASCRERVS